MIASSNNSITPRILVNRICSALKTASLPEALHESYAWQIIEHSLGISRTHCITMPVLIITDAQQASIDAALHELVVEHKPIQYIRGSVPFLTAIIDVVPPILIPRPETEEWVDILIERFSRRASPPEAILDLCTGTGCIAIAVAQAFLEARVDGVDTSHHAITLAQSNATHNNVEQCRFLCGDLYAPVAGYTYDLIVANPPYIPQSYNSALDPSVLLWEDHKALFAGDDGLDVIRTIITHAHRYATPGKPLELWIEIDRTHARIVDQLLCNAQFEDRELIKDAAGNPRVARGIYHG